MFLSHVCHLALADKMSPSLTTTGGPHWPSSWRMFLLGALRNNASTHASNLAGPRKCLASISRFEQPILRGQTNALTACRNSAVQTFALKTGLIRPRDPVASSVLIFAAWFGPPGPRIRIPDLMTMSKRALYTGIMFNMPLAHQRAYWRCWPKVGTGPILLPTPPLRGPDQLNGPCIFNPRAVYMVPSGIMCIALEHPCCDTVGPGSDP